MFFRCFTKTPKTKSRLAVFFLHTRFILRARRFYFRCKLSGLGDLFPASGTCQLQIGPYCQHLSIESSLRFGPRVLLRPLYRIHHHPHSGLWIFVYHHLFTLLPLCKIQDSTVKRDWNIYLQKLANSKKLWFLVDLRVCLLRFFQLDINIILNLAAVGRKPYFRYRTFPNLSVNQ